ncbi:cytochrome P450 2U1-like [Glandiceps talaboti]
MLDIGFVSALCLFLLAALIIICVRYYTPPCKNFPPGPWGVPIIGSIGYHVGRSAHKDMTNLAKKYGNVYSIKLGNSVLVILNGISAIKEAMIKSGDDFADRPTRWSIEQFNPKHEGIINGYLTDSFLHWRRVLHTILRGFGFGQSSMETMITKEVDVLVWELRKLEGNPCCLGNLLHVSVANVIGSIAFGRRFEYDDVQFQSLVHSFSRWVELNLKIADANFFPLLRLFKGKVIKEHNYHFEKVQSFCKTEIAEHKATLEPSNIRDFIDAYLVEAQTQDNERFSESELKQVLSELFIAGTETTAMTLRWALLFMILYPDIQEKVFIEINQVVGESRRPNCNDEINLPFTKALLLEIQRVASVVPLSVPHAALKDATIQNCTIPKGTIVLNNLWSVHHDPVAWPEPDKFDPYRFYDDENNSVKKHESFLPFGAGRRMCMGEKLAKQELFLYFTSMIHQFKFALPTGVKRPDTEGTLGLTLVPKPYDLVINPRKF